MTTFGARILAPLMRFSLGYADTLLRGVEPDRFATKPSGIDTNHPAFIYGHLAIYPERLLELCGRASLMEVDPKFTELFAAGKPCVDDPARTIYPPMETILSRFRRRHEAVLPVLAECGDDIFDRPNPNERMKDRFPTVGIACAFLVNGHMMMHLGQMSAWRRCMGLPSAS